MQNVTEEHIYLHIICIYREREIPLLGHKEAKLKKKVIKLIFTESFNTKSRW